MKNLLINPGIIKRIKTFLTGKYVEDGNTASQNIPAGKWVIWKNQMCQAKTAITTGDTLSSTNLDVQGDDGAVNALSSKPTLLWTNTSSPGSMPTNTHIDLDKNYKYYIIEVAFDGNLNMFGNALILNENVSQTMIAMNPTATNAHIRKATPDNTGITFGEGVMVGVQTHATVCVPNKIYGI